MLVKNNQQNYGLISIALHWLIAIVTFGLFGLGLWMVELGYYDEWSQKASGIHEGTGILLFLFLLIRIVWRRVNIMPVSSKNHKEWEVMGAYFTHRLLIVLLLILSVSGYFIVTANGEAINVFGLFDIPASLSGLSNQADWAGDFHLLFAWGLISLAVGHAIVSLKHHFIDKDSTLKRMLGL